MHKSILNRKFWKYVLPSMFAMLLSGFYSIIDGLFVGNAIGNTALAAINVAYPIQVILNASAIGIGIGGAVTMSTYIGCNNREKSEQSLGSTVALLFSIGILLSFILYNATPTLLRILGARNEVYDAAYEYIYVILLGGLLPIFGNGLNPLLRNNGKTIQATLSMSSGLVTNIVLDCIFVFKANMGLHGAALATIIAQAVVALSGFLLLYFSKMRYMNLSRFIPTISIVKKIIRVGVSPFGQTLIPCIITILTNWMCIKYGGDDALTIFSVVCYVLASAQLLLQGIGDGIQPLLSYSHGKHDDNSIHYLYRKAFFVALVVSLLLCILTCGFADQLAYLFGVSQSLTDGTKVALTLTSLSYPFIGIIRLTCAVFYATGRAKKSTLLIYLEPCMLFPFTLIFFSSLFGLNGVWSAYPAAQVILCVLSLILMSPNVIINKQLHTLDLVSDN